MRRTTKTLLTFLLLTSGTSSCVSSRPAPEPRESAPVEKQQPLGVGWLSIATEPAGVEVIIDGVRVGQTPLTTEQPPGDRFVVLQYERQNYGPYTVTVAPDERMEAAFSMAELRGTAATREPGPERFRLRRLGRFGRGSAVVRTLRSTRAHAGCFPPGWAGADAPNPQWVVVRLEFGGTGRLSRARVMHPAGTLAMERCLQDNLGMRFQRRQGDRVGPFELTLKLRLR